MGTRFLLTCDSNVSNAVKEIYLSTDVNGTIVTTAVDGMPHRVLRTELVDKLVKAGPIARLPARRRATRSPSRRRAAPPGPRCCARVRR